MNLYHNLSEVNYAIYTFSICDMRIEYIDEVVTSIKLHEPLPINYCGLRTPLTDLVSLQLREYFEGKRKEFTFAWRVQGTDFQQKVWRALYQIPYGERRTYKDIAIAIGSPLSSRAVGMACNRNPMMIVVPCHRVIGAGGKLIGYAAGIELKAKLLNIENDQRFDLIHEKR